jgi:hypothetical protein
MAKIPPAVVCDRCGASIAAGADRALMRLSLTAGFDGYIPEPRDEDVDLQAAVLACHTATEEELEEQVHLERAFTLCQLCRTHIARNPLQRPASKGGSGRLH